MKTGLFLTIVLSCAASVSAQFSDDSGISEGPSDSAAAIMSEARLVDGSLLFQAEAYRGGEERESLANEFSGTIFLTDEKGGTRPGAMVEVTLRNDSGVIAKTETDAEGNWSMPSSDPAAAVRLRFQNKFWSIRGAASSSPYEWEASTGAFRLNPSSANGDIGFIQLQFADAIYFLNRNGVPTGWWKKAVAVKYPGDANYYTGDSIVLTRAKAWDVNLHEFGHAVMYGGTDSHGGGGQHYINKCYTAGLAWSEGFATFFAGAVRLDINAPDAKFEYLASGMTIENVPDSACKGSTNEWRVGAALWDIYDAHQDGSDGVSLPFRRVWDPIQGQTMSGFQDAWKYMKASLQADELKNVQGALEQNALSERRAEGANPEI